MNFPIIFSILFSIACAIYIFIGTYAFYLNHRSKTNILFFAMAISLSIWSLGFSISIAADSPEVVLFWRRFAAIGFGAFYAILLHFLIIFTNNDAIFCTKRFYILLYSPVVVTYLGFTFLPNLNPNQYNMEKTPLGWINIAVNNFWDIFFIVYYIVYFLTSLYLIWRWGKNSDNPKEKKISRLINGSFFLTIFIGAITDTLANSVFGINLPQLAPILMVFPATIVYYSIRKYGMLNPDYVIDDAILMSEQIRIRLTNYLSIAFLFAAVINFSASYFLTNNNGLGSSMLLSGLFAVISISIMFIQRLIKQKTIKDILIAAIFSMVVPLLSFRYLSSAGTTVWAFAFTLLIVSIVFDQKFVQIILSISITVTQIVIWIVNPVTTTTIDNADHLVRLGIYLAAIWFARFSSRIFHTKLRENAEQIGFQKITTEISTEFISINDQNLNRKIDSALSKIGEFLKPNRVFIYMFDEEKERLTCRGVWKDDSVSEDIDIEINETNYPMLFRRIEVGNIITLSDISESLSLTEDDIPRLLRGYDKSFVAMPIIIKNKIYGFFGIDSKSMTKAWPETQLGFFRIISLIFSAAFERIQQEREIIELAYYDSLTKLPNRFLFKDRVTQMIRLSERINNTFAVIFVDIDAFKAVNGSIGHDGGDSLIAKLAEQLTKTLRKSDTIARFGGDEFLIMLTNLSSTDVIPKIMDKIIHLFNKPFVINEQEFFVTVSAGITVYPYDGRDADSLIKNADLAMQKSKELGKNRYMFCTDDMREEVLLKMKLTNNLFRVLDKQELVLYYQPQVSTKTGKIVGVEALLRWLHPEYGFISPGIFIPIAEQTGLIGSIGDWVLREACRQCMEWHSKGLPDIRIAVNVSLLQLRHPKFVRRVAQILKETKLEPKYLDIELTESAAVDNSDYIIDILNNLKKLGITISIDDFGTEYSSLSRLSTMPIDRIKLDMQFVHSINKSNKENAIIKSIIELSHALGLKVVAEGVETESQLSFLTEHSSDVIQGYYFFRPVSPQDLENILKQNHNTAI